MTNKPSTFNSEKRIRLIDKDDNFIMMLNQVEAFQALKYGHCQLLWQKPPTLQFNSILKNWKDHFLFRRKNKNIGSLDIRQSHLYGNYHVQSPDGIEMFHCNSERILWYLNRDLIDFVDNKTVKFKFVPKGMGHINDDYYLTEKINQCVVCGKKRELTRHHIVPYVFSRYFPIDIKCHRYHDILLTCVDCHNVYEKDAFKLKAEICEEYGAFQQSKFTLLEEELAVKKAAKPLKNHWDDLPDFRREKLLDVLRKYLGKEEISSEEIEQLSQIDVHKECEINHYGKQVAENIKDMQAFFERWRKHFVSVMNPQFMPVNWSLEKPYV